MSQLIIAGGRSFRFRANVVDTGTKKKNRRQEEQAVRTITTIILSALSIKTVGSRHVRVKNKEHAIVNADETRHTHTHTRGVNYADAVSLSGRANNGRKKKNDKSADGMEKREKTTVCQSSQGYRCEISHVHA